MTKHFKVIQSQHEINVQAQLIKKLYDLASKHELTEEEYDNTTNLIGEITLASPTYKEWADKVKETFPELTINSLYYMLFQDPAVESVMSAYLLSKGLGDGIGITYDDAKSNAISQLPNLKNNTDIQYFNELPNFEKITIINGQQFMGCSNLKEINLSNIDLISYSTFMGCSSLEKITLGHVTSVPAGFAGGCKKLTTVENSSLLTTISEDAFGQCTLLENIDLSNVQTVGRESFFCASALGEVDLSNIITVGNRGFSLCSNLKLKYSLLPNLSSLDAEAFIGTKIESIDAPNCISIGNSALQDCQLLTSVNMPSLQTIGQSAFYNDNLLSINVNFPSLLSIGYQAFYYCKSITKISNLGSVTNLPDKCFSNCKALTAVENDALDNVTSIGKEAFISDNLLTSVGNLSNITSIGGAAFQNCSALTSISLPETITSIGSHCFEDCSSLIINNLNLSNLISLGEAAFRQTKLQQISSLGNITTIPNKAFSGCTSLSTIINNATNNITQYNSECFYNCNLLTSINISSNVTSIGASAFTNCSSLVIDDLNCPNLTSIGQDAFKGTKLKKISNLGNCSSIGKGAFQNCTLLTTIENDALYNITVLSNNMFNGCTSLTSLGNMSNLKNIKGSALSNTGISYLDLSSVENIENDAINSNNTYIEFKLTDSGCIDMRNIKTLGSWPFGDRVISANSNYIDCGSNLKSVGAEVFIRFKINIIIRSTDTSSFVSNWRNLKPYDGYYVYVHESVLTEFQTIYSTYASSFKTIENDLPAEYR